MNPLKINDTTYQVAFSPGNRVEIGDGEAAEFRPRLKLERWGGESYIKVGLPTAARGVPVVEGEKLRWAESDIEACFYPLEPVVVGGFTQNRLGGFEFEIVLKKKPPTGRIMLEIETRGLEYYYQPPLTPEEIAEGAVRPDNVVGSYAVYHSARGGIHQSRADADKYRCGKAFHIYRPKIIDAGGDWVWAGLDIDQKAGTLTITIDPAWLDKTAYPVVVDPSFGYESVGATSSFSSSKNMYWTKFSITEDGVAQSVTKYLQVDGTYGDPYRLHIYADDGGYPGQFLATTGEDSPPLTAGWVELDLTTNPNLYSGTAYWLGTFSDYDMHRYWYDSGETNQTYYIAHYSYPTHPDPVPGGATARARIVSIYCTYTTGGATAKSGSDAGSGAEAKAPGNPSATLSGGEAASGIDLVPGRDIALPESGSGADAVVSLEMPSAKTAADDGSGVDSAIPGAALTDSESGIGVDALVSLNTPQGKTASDNGSGAEAAIPGAILAGTESGNGIDAFIARLLAAAESGSGAEASVAGGGGEFKELLAAELGEGADELTAKIETPTKGGGMRLWT